MARQSKKTPSSSLQRSPLHLLHRVEQCAGAVFLAELGEADLTARQYAVLLTVAEHQGMSQTQIVEQTGIDRSTIADIVRRLLNKKLLQRKRTAEDARAYAVKLTERGKSILKSVTPRVRRVDDKILAALPASKQKRFAADLALVVDAMTAQKE